MISHIGMSSFERYTILLVCDEIGNQRLLWQCGENQVKECWVNAYSVESVAKEVVEWFEING